MGDCIGRVGVSLSGRVELDGKYVRISFKGTKPGNMPRKSKRRSHGGAGHAHKICVIFVIDELDSFVGRVVGIGDETREKADRMLPFLKGCRVLITDDKSCYEGFAMDNGFANVQIKTATSNAN